MQDIRVILQIDDDNLLRDVVHPLQKERKFNRLLTELLYAYYKDEYVNASATISMESKDQSSREELLKNLKGMRDNIEALQFLNEEAKNLTEEGEDIFTTVVTSSVKNEKVEEPKMIGSENFVTRDEFNKLVEGQSKILELLKGGSLFQKAKESVEVVFAEKEEIKTEPKEVSTDIEEVITEKEEPNTSEEVDGSDIAASLLAGMDFNF